MPKKLQKKKSLLALGFAMIFAGTPSLEAIGITTEWIGTTNNMSLNSNWNDGVPNGNLYRGLFDGNNFTPSLTAAMLAGEFQFNSPTQYVFQIQSNLTLGVNGIEIQPNSASPVFTLNGGSVNFTGSATSSSSIFNSISSGNFNGVVFGTVGGTDTCSAGNSVINIAGPNCELIFQAHTTAATSTLTLTNHFGTAVGIQFLDNSTAASSSIIISDSALVGFSNSSTGGNCSIEATNNSKISLAISSTNISIGSISTDNTSEIDITQNINLTLGSNNLDTTIDGTIFNSNRGSRNNFSLVKVGTGTTTFTNAVSLSEIQGTITINAGALQVDTTSLANQNVISNSLLIFNQANGDGTYTGQVTGTGGIQKIGGSTLILPSDNSGLSGSSSVNAGNLKVNGLLGGTVSVNSGGILSGTGTLNNIIINSGGILAPGNSIGTINVAGNLTQNSGTYAVQISEEGQSTLTNVAGTATLNGGTVQVTSVDLVTTPQEYTILHADGGVIGTFSGVTFTNSLLRAMLSYDPNNVFLALKLAFAPVAVTRNQSNVALQLESLFNDTPNAAQTAFLNSLTSLSDPEIESVLDKLSGDQYTSILQVGRMANRRFLRQLYDPIRYDLFYSNSCCDCDCACSNEQGMQVWTDFEGGRAFFHRNDEFKGYSDYNYDASIGVQTHLCPELILGVAAGYEYDRLKYDLAGHGRVHTGQGAVYAAFTQPVYYLFSDLVGGWSDFKVVRPIEYTGNSLTAFGNTHSYHATWYTEYGLNFDLNCFMVQPFVGLDVSYFRFNNVHEHGTGVVDLDIRGKSIIDTDTYAGVHLLTGLSQDIILTTDLSWVRSYHRHDNRIAVNFQGFGDVFPIIGINDGRNGFAGAVTVAKTFCDTITAYAEFSGEAWSHLTNYSGTIGLLAEW